MYSGTAEAGKGKNQLLNLARKWCTSKLDKRLLEDLKGEKVGMIKIETEAWRLKQDTGKYDQKTGEERKKLKGKKLVEAIQEQRSQEKVCDLLRLKVKYCHQESARLRKS